jgi:hypothetical protein
VHLHAAPESASPSGVSSANPLAALLANAYRHFAIGDASDDYLAELAAAFRAAADQHPHDAPSLLILTNAIANLIDAPDRSITLLLHALRVLAELVP